MPRGVLPQDAAVRRIDDEGQRPAIALRALVRLLEMPDGVVETGPAGALSTRSPGPQRACHTVVALLLCEADIPGAVFVGGQPQTRRPHARVERGVHAHEDVV